MREPNTAAVLPREGADACSEEFFRTFNELGPQLLRMLAAMLGNHADAEDVRQNTFLKCWRAWASAGPVRNVRAWIFRIGVNTAKDLKSSAWGRHAKPLYQDSRIDVGCQSNPSLDLQEKELLEQVHRTLVVLRPEERAVFLLRQNTDLSYDEIAARCHIPVGTAKTHMRCALAKLREALR